MTDEHAISVTSMQAELRSDEGFTLITLGDLHYADKLGDDWTMQVGAQSDIFFSECRDNLRKVPVGLVLAARSPEVRSIRSDFAEALGANCDSHEVRRIMRLIEDTGYHLELNDDRK